jgi:hypothetical protein
MAASPIWKVYTESGEYVASCKWVTLAAMLMASDFPHMGAGTIRYGHGRDGIVWTEGVDGSAAESFDAVADTIENRMRSGVRELVSGQKEGKRWLSARSRE